MRGRIKIDLLSRWAGEGKGEGDSLSARSARDRSVFGPMARFAHRGRDTSLYSCKEKYPRESTPRIARHPSTSH